MAGRLGRAVLTAAVLAGIANTIIALIARGPGGVSGEFLPVQPGTYLPLTVIGVLFGAIGWAVVDRRFRNPAAVLRLLVPVTLALSFIPDISLGRAKFQPHTTWGGVAALMTMHLAVAAVAIPIYRRFLPVGQRNRAL